ncbi:MAG: uracil-DNA glycosylase family protein [Halobacteria archaeon]
MDHVSDRVRNPFNLGVPEGMEDCTTVHGYGDASADFHLIGDHPGSHGGVDTGVPFTETRSGRKLQSVMHEVGFLKDEYGERPAVDNFYMSYVNCCFCGGEPALLDYALTERFFDAELRAINAHILMPVGEKALRTVLQNYTNQAHRFEDRSLGDLHGRHIRGMGFMVVPIEEPLDWRDGVSEELVSNLEAILNSNYLQTKGVATRIG